MSNIRRRSEKFFRKIEHILADAVNSEPDAWFADPRESGKTQATFLIELTISFKAYLLNQWTSSSIDHATASKRHLEYCFHLRGNVVAWRRRVRQAPDTWGQPLNVHSATGNDTRTDHARVRALNLDSTNIRLFEAILLCMFLKVIDFPVQYNGSITNDHVVALQDLKVTCGANTVEMFNHKEGDQETFVIL